MGPASNADDRLGRAVAGTGPVEIGQDVGGSLVQCFPEGDDLGQRGSYAPVRSAGMWAFYSGARRNLDQDDIDGIQSLYCVEESLGSF